MLTAAPDLRCTDPSKIKIKGPDQFTLIGTEQRNRDIPVKVTGKAVYGIDVVIPLFLLHFEYRQKSDTSACGRGKDSVPGKKEFGLSAHRTSLSGPSAPLANWVRRSIGTWRTAASYCR
jgi:hypothetical protein